MTDRYLKKVKYFEDSVVAPAKNSDWWTSEHTAKVNAYLSKIKAFYTGKSAATLHEKSDEDIGYTALTGLKYAISFELPANKFKFITKQSDLDDYMEEAMRIKSEKDNLMKAASKDVYNRDVASYRELVKKVNACEYPEVRKKAEDKLKKLYGEDGLKTLYDRREAAKKKLASVYGIHIE